MAYMPYSGMKMTMHIDEALLAEVMAATGTTTKTAAVHEALRKIATKYRQRERWKQGLGMSADEIGTSFDPDVALGLRGHNPPLTTEEMSLIAEPASKYGKKRAR
ncbi:MAG: type II toxin-antitoxin system VapB family antitoxin [Verrucomicrobiaceae bacterium]